VHCSDHAVPATTVCPGCVLDVIAGSNVLLTCYMYMWPRVVPFQFSRFISFRFILIFISFFTRQIAPLLGVKLLKTSVLRCRTAAAHITSKKGGIYCHIALTFKGLGPVGAPIHSCTAQQVYCQGRSLQHQVPRMGFLGKTNHHSSDLQLLYVFMHATANNKAKQFRHKPTHAILWYTV
jgi:hypothetical protein